jgi:hypothetical protein
MGRSPAIIAWLVLWNSVISRLKYERDSKYGRGAGG